MLAVRSASATDRSLIVGAVVFDVFSGQGLPAGKKSVAKATGAVLRT